MSVYDNFDDRLFEGSVRILWGNYGITYFPIVAIVFAMAMAPSMLFEEALHIWCDEGCEIFDWPRVDTAVMRSLICAKLLVKAEAYPEGIEKWFEHRAGEVRQYADRVSSGQRG